MRTQLGHRTCAILDISILDITAGNNALAEIGSFLDSAVNT
ncbi:hypothetical protein [Bradyrhizobium tropiciagri]|nr:hypothetical protein [Bradyrhizobium tropiciagri]